MTIEYVSGDIEGSVYMNPITIPYHSGGYFTMLTLETWYRCGIENVVLIVNAHCVCFHVISKTFILKLCVTLGANDKSLCSLYRIQNNPHRDWLLSAKLIKFSLCWKNAYKLMWILKHSKDLLNSIASPFFSKIYNIKTYDLCILYTTIHHGGYHQSMFLKYVSFIGKHLIIFGITPFWF